MPSPSPKGSKSSSGPKSEKAGLRREAREAAVQFLYQLDTPGTHPSTPGADFWKLRSGTHDPDDPKSPLPPAPLPQKARTFSENLILGVQLHREALDACIGRFTRNYELSRIAAVDRNILRLAVYEMLHTPKVPLVVAINEAIEIAKKFGSEESGRFVNGILDQIRTQVAQAARKAAAASQTEGTPSNSTDEL
jgi:N utilization substance protein B